MNKAFLYAITGLLLGFIFQACVTQHKIESVHKIEVAPMHITIDVNVKIDRALDDFFGDLDEAEEQLQPGEAEEQSQPEKSEEQSQPEEK